MTRRALLCLCLCIAAFSVRAQELTERDRALSRLQDIQRKFDYLLDIRGVEGTAVVPAKTPFFVVYLSDRLDKSVEIPSKFDNYELRRVRVDEFRALTGAKMGTSTSNDGACLAGTLGIAVTDGRRQGYITNAHVAAVDKDGCLNGEIAGQVAPGKKDVHCDDSTPVGTLAKAIEIPRDGVTMATVDAAFVVELAGAIDPANDCGICPADLSLISPANAVGMNVRKCGRSNKGTAVTGLVGPVSGRIWVRYACGLRVLFEDQIVVEGAKFARPGDSGSVAYGETKGVVGLVFAGGGKLALLNPIGEVLTELGVTIDKGRHCR